MFIYKSTFCNTLPVGCLKFCFSLKIRSSISPFTISFQDNRTESSTISRLAHCNAYWSTASHKSDKFLSQSTLHGSLYFSQCSLQSSNQQPSDLNQEAIVGEDMTFNSGGTDYQQFVCHGLNSSNNTQNVYLEAGSHDLPSGLSNYRIRPCEHIKGSLSILILNDS